MIPSGAGKDFCSSLEWSRTMANFRPLSLMRTVVTNQATCIQATRRFLADLIQSSYPEGEAAQCYAERLATASSELLENATKYSPPGSRLFVQLVKSPTCLILQVRNPLQDEAKAVLRSIKREIGTVWSEKDAREAFQKRVIASLAHPDAKAMLGYSKIRMETSGRIRARLDPLGRICITLVFPLSPPDSVR